MIRMIVIGPRRENHVGVPLANPPDHLQPDIEAGQQFSVVIVENLVGDSQAPPGLLGLQTPALGQRPSTFRLMPCVTVGHRDELDCVSQRRKLRRSPARPDVAIIGMSAERNHPQLAALGKHYRHARQQEHKPSQHAGIISRRIRLSTSLRDPYRALFCRE